MFASNSSQVSNDAVYVEDVFSTYLYTGNGSTQTINNGIDLAGKGGLVWVKSRDVASGHFLYDTSRGVNQYLASNTTAASANYNSSLTAFNSNGFTLGFNLGNVDEKYASWTFRKQPKFFDVVTYTGNGSSTQVINHSLGARPGAIFFKKVSSTSNWVTYNRASDTSTLALFLNKTDAGLGISNSWMTSTNFTAYQLGADTGLAADNMNDSGATYVAYLFAHNAGGFGLTGADNVISCGSFSSGSPGNNTTVNLGYEPQWIIFKNTQNGSEGWWMYDTMRGWTGSLGTAGDKYLFSNSSGAEGSITNYINVTSTGFVMQGGAFATDQTFIYIAIRRGPMKTPTSGTSVFAVNLAADGATAPVTWSTGFNVDSVLTKRNLSDTNGNNIFVDRLRGNSATLTTNSTSAEGSNGNITDLTISNGYIQKLVSTAGSGGAVTYAFGRAPGFFDEVCYTGTGADNTQITHNLGVAPELIITKKRSSTGDWWTLCTADAARRVGRVNLTNAFTNSGIASIFGNGTSYVAPTASVFTLGSGSTSTNTSGATYVAYLFASCPGVSKVGSYTGTGATQTINCGFTGGARFVMIKRTDTTSDWFVWDTARGMVAGTDPSLSLNTTAAEVNANSAYTNTGGFQLLASPAADINTNGGTYIYLAIA